MGVIDLSFSLCRNVMQLRPFRAFLTAGGTKLIVFLFLVNITNSVEGGETHATILSEQLA